MGAGQQITEAQVLQLFFGGFETQAGQENNAGVLSVRVKGLAF